MGKKLTKRGKHPGGRPTKIVEAVIKKLVEAFMNDFTIEEACRFAGISKPTYYSACERDPEFLSVMEAAQDYPLTLAKKTLLNGIRHGMDKASLALKLLERRQRDRYAPKVINQHEGAVPVTYAEAEQPTPAKSPAEAKKLAESN